MSSSTTEASSSTSAAWQISSFAVIGVGLLQVLYMCLKEAYEIRLYAINEFGRVIHEFDPYFNYRATEYLYWNGWKKFSQWFDYMVWYPLGRPVGTTIYPGMQFTSVWIKQFLLPDWSINDICCFVPAWFGVIATLSTAALCYVSINSLQSTKGSKSLLTDVPIVSQVTNLIILKSRTMCHIDRYALGSSTSGESEPKMCDALFSRATYHIVTR